MANGGASSAASAAIALYGTTRPRIPPIAIDPAARPAAAASPTCLLQGFTIGIDGWEYAGPERAGSARRSASIGMGYGALLIMGGLFFLFTQRPGGARVRSTATSSWSDRSRLIVAVVAIFIFFPVSRILVSARSRTTRAPIPWPVFAGKLFSAKIWGLHCLARIRTRLRRRLELLRAGSLGRDRDRRCSASLSRLIATRTGFRLQARAARPDRPTDHHAAVRDWARA